MQFNLVLLLLALFAAVSLAAPANDKRAPHDYGYHDKYDYDYGYGYGYDYDYDYGYGYNDYYKHKSYKV